MAGLDLPIEVIEEYILEKYYGKDGEIVLRERADRSDGGLDITYEYPKGSEYPLIQDVVLTFEEIKGLVEKVQHH